MAISGAGLTRDSHESYTTRDDSRVIIHFDYDCFYASVFEAQDPSLKHKPLAIQQKQLVVTCNYEARRRGLRKLQHIRDARKTCPDVVIRLGEDLTPFRDASKDLLAFLSGYAWGGRVERLGFDEVSMDVTSMIQHNINLLNHNFLKNSFFHLSQDDPTIGFSYDATTIAGPTYPASQTTDIESPLAMRLLIGSHLAWYLRHELENQKGYTSSAGISTSKLLAKLAGSLHKPHSQTTLVPPYDDELNGSGRVVRLSHVRELLDERDIREIPGIGSKLAKKLKSHFLEKRENELTSSDKLTVSQLRAYPGIGPTRLAKVLQGFAFPKDTGSRVWGLINGIDPSPVSEARSLPTQVSIENSYGSLEGLQNVRRELGVLCRRLVQRMQIDLTSIDEGGEDDNIREKYLKDESSPHPSSTSRDAHLVPRRWLTQPRTLRLSTRPRLPPPNADGSRPSSHYSIGRTSRSCPMPRYACSLDESIDAIAERLVGDCFLPLFHKLHPPGKAFKLSLLNVAATNMGEPFQKVQPGRDIASMFHRKRSNAGDHVESSSPATPSGVGIEDASTLKEIKASGINSPSPSAMLHVDRIDSTPADDVDEGWVSDFEDETASNQKCTICDAYIPSFAVKAHATYHSLPD